MRVLHNGFATNFGLVGKNMRRYMATTALTATGLMAIPSPAIANNWTDHVASEGSISIDTSVVNTTNITQHTHFVKVHGNGDINAGWTVNLAQPSSSSKYVLYDVKDDPTRILGTLNANGQVYIFDKNGVIFGEGSQVNVGSIITSTGFISDANIKSNKLVFENVGGMGAGEIVNAGTITVADAGLAAFVAPTLKNSGKISAKAGKIVLASGETVTLDLYGDNLVEIAADGALANALIDNSGTIEAAGGTVVLSAQAAKDAVDSVINMDGVVDVSSVSVKGGKIVLSGGNKGVVKVAGSLKADGQTGGGDVKVTGQNIHMTETSTVAASALTTGDGGIVDIIAQDGLVYGGSVGARGGVFGGNGGAVDTSGLGWVDIYGTVDAAAYNGANGTWLIDPSNLDIISILPGFVTGSNPFSPTGGALTSSRLRNTVVNAALTGGTNVIVTTVGSSDKFLQDGTITVKADITSAGSGTLTLQAAGGIVVEAGKTIAAAFGHTLNVVMDAVKDIKLHGATINTRGGSVDFKAGDDITLTGLTQINTAGGNALFNSVTGSFYVANGSAVNTAGGNLDVRAQGPVTTLLGLPVNGNIKVQGVLNAGGGNIDLKQSGLFIGDANSLRTSGTGTVSVQQNSFEWLGLQLASIQNAIDAINNTGTGTNTVTVSTGTFKESLKADVNNLILKGAKAGVSGSDASRGTGETIINPNSPGVVVTADNVTIDGLTFANATGADGYGIHVDGASNTVIKNNVVYNTSQHGIFAEGANGLRIERNKVTDTRADAIHVVNSTGAVLIDRNEIGEVDTDIDANGIYLESTDGAVISYNTLRNIGESAIYVKDSDRVTIGRFHPAGSALGTNNKIYGAKNGITVDGGGETRMEIFFNQMNDIEEAAIRGIDSSHLKIWGNWIKNGADIGIHVTGGTNSADITNNTIENVTAGIRLENIGAGPDNIVYGNRIKFVDGDGIYATNSEGLIIEKNRISDIGGRGIYVTETAGAKILENTLWAITGEGIFAEDANGLNIEKNKVTDTRADGIHVVNSTGAVLIDRNEIGEVATSVDGNGIYLENTDGAVISYNTLRNIGESAIYVKDSDRVTIGRFHPAGSALGTNNKIYGAQYGITVDGGGETRMEIFFNQMNDIEEAAIRGIDSSHLKIWGNWIKNGADIGIHVTGGTNSADITNNTIENVTAGIRLENIGAGPDNIVYGNRIKFVDGDGIYATNSEGLIIEKNRISDIGGRGIAVWNSAYIQNVKILLNDIWNVNWDGIYVNGGQKAVILKNTVTDVGDDGIKTEGVRKVIVKENTVTGAGDDGITLLGYGMGIWPELDEEEGGEEEFESARIITPMIVEDEGYYDSYNPWKAIVKGNTVSNSGQDGIEVSGFDTIIVTEGNDVSGSGENGLFISGGNNGYVVVSGNIFDNNKIGAHFQSGLIDLTGEGNVFTAGDTGMIGLRFAPYEYRKREKGDYYESEPAFAQLDLSLLEIYLPPSGFAPLKLVDDGLSYPNVPGTFDGTIGSQTFTGYTELGKFYVELDNEAFFDPGRPTLLNGLNSTYDGLLPASTDGLLTQAQFDYLEARFQHFPDSNDLGLFWFGFVPSGFDGDQKDLFNLFDSFSGGTSGLNVRIVGLPRLPGQGAGPGGTTPQNLNDIETFGGNPAALNEIETSAGGTPEDLANIETEAGGDNANCWSDAVGIAGTGQVVNVVYGGTMADTLDQAANCGTAF